VDAQKAATSRPHARRDDAAEPERDSQAEASLPRLPTAGETKTPDLPWRERIRRFHVTGEGGDAPGEAVAIRPAVLPALAARERAAACFPLAVIEESDAAGVARLSRLVENAAREAEEAGESLQILSGEQGRVAAAVERALEGRAEPATLGEILDSAGERLRESFDLSEAAATALGDEFGAIAARLPTGAALIGLGEGTFFHLHAISLSGHRGAARGALNEEIDGIVRRLEEMLRADTAYGPEGSSSEALAASLGQSQVDSEALSRNLPSPRGPQRLDPDRRERIESCLSRLKAHRSASEGEPHAVVIHDGALPADLELQGMRVMRDPDPLAASQRIFEGLAESAVEALRAYRTAGLELANAFDPDRHGPALSRLDWQALTAEELLALPAVVAVQTGEDVERRSLATLSELLRSGRPLQVVILEPCASGDGEGADRLAGHHRGLGDLAVAHREAFVLQSSLSRPEQLLDGLAQMAVSLGPAVAIVAVPSWSSPVPPTLQLVAALEGRATPCFRYDPAAGLTWAARFDVEGNPQPDRAWPAHELSFENAEGKEDSREDPFTFAHAAALDPAYRSHLMVVPPEAWDDEQVEIAVYLAEALRDPPQKVPYLWVLDGGGTLQRAVMTREMAFACRDRMRAWRVLQELAGTDNEYARRAAEEARSEALAEAERERAALAEQHAKELEEVRLGAATEVMERLARALTGDEEWVPAKAGALPPPAAYVAAPEAVEPEPAEEEEEEEAVSFDEPYIDTVLCTTCNECTNLNPRLFKYDGNKQAYLADIAAGTFEDLVVGAEKCPAKCIHPGKPRDGDATATAEMLTRAEPFN
jgi:ferredoxin